MSDSTLSAKNSTESAPVEYWEQVGETTRWGHYLAAKETAIILRGLQLANAPAAAVDVGCGGGRWSKLLWDRGWKMTCVEIDEMALRSCQQKMPTALCIKVAPSDEGIPCATGSQRLFLCMEAPEVIEKKWFGRESARILEDSGYLIGFYMNPNSWLGWLWKRQRNTPSHSIPHYVGPAYYDWKRDFISHGFEVLHEESYAWAPFSRGSNSPLIPLATALERLLGLKHFIRFAPWVLFIARKTARRRGSPAAGRVESA